ncbi:hypothetical protein H4Q26_011959 [Puccinia striiformis f. sp. tritici PST-130]|nr:hypothetical protein H4Q26_011959 [Puccinia striiformis f. sp. tritici PST-130]
MSQLKMVRQIERGRPPRTTLLSIGTSSFFSSLIYTIIMEVDFEDLVTKQIDPNDPNQTRTQAEHAALLTSLDRATRSRQLAVPTNEVAIRVRLRELGEPMTLFGERPEDRRDRLRYVLSQIAEAKGWELEKEAGTAGMDEGGAEGKDDSESDDDEEFYTEGSEELLVARRSIADFSLANARKRITRQKLETHLPLSKIMATRKAVYAELKTYTNLGSRLGMNVQYQSLDSRPILSKESKNIFKGHSDRIGGLAWHPGATLSQSTSSVNFITGGADAKVQLWSLDNEQPLRTLEGHGARVCRSLFILRDDTLHLVPSIQLGDSGMSKRGLGSESGKTVMVLDGHVKDILAIDFSPNGHQIATGSNDDNIRIWDIRTLKQSTRFQPTPQRWKCKEEKQSAAAYLNGSDRVKLEEGASNENEVEVPLSGLYLASSGYDGYVKLWSADDWQLIKAMSSEAGGRVMSVDVGCDGKFMASGEWTRTFKLWSAENVSLTL